MAPNWGFAQQISPNPNPVGNTITNTSSTGYNDLNPFDNYGTLDNAAGATLTNNTGAAINNYAGATFSNEGSFLNATSANVNNSGTLTNSGAITNNGFIGSGGIFTNLSGGIIINAGAGVISHGGNEYFNNEGVLVNFGTIGTGGHSLTNDAGATLVNDASGTIQATTSLVLNLGTLNNAGSILAVGGGIENGAGGTINNAGDLEAGMGWFHNAFGATMNNTSPDATLIATSFRNDGTLNNAGWAGGDGSIVNSSTGILNNSGRVSASTGAIVNAGVLNNAAGGELRSGQLVNSGTLTNSGSVAIRYFGNTASTNTGVIVNAAGGVITMSNYAELVNDGQIINGDATFAVLAGASVTGTGTYTQSSSNPYGAGTLIVDGSMTQSHIEIDSGTLSGSGTITAPVTINGGTIAPGDSPGTLTINGNLDFQSGTLLTEIGGTGAGQFDLLNIIGKGSFLAGVLGFSFIDGFLPSLGDSWTFLTATDGLYGWQNLTTSFSGVDGYRFNLAALGDTGLTLRVASISPVPEPETYALLLVGLGLMGFVLRRRKRVALAA